MNESELYKAALSRAMAICSRREYCSEEIRERLNSWNVSGIESDRIIQDLKKENFINEARYAAAYVKDKFNYNKWGRIKIRAGLRMKKISAEIIGTALDSIDNELYRKTLENILMTHRKSVRGKNQYEIKGKLLRYGMSKGFESELLYDILGDSF